jgi:hypothetical protein
MAKFKIIVCKRQDPKVPVGVVRHTNKFVRRNWVQYDYQYRKTANTGTVFEVPYNELTARKQQLTEELESTYPNILVSFIDLPDH